MPCPPFPLEPCPVAPGQEAQRPRVPGALTAWPVSLVLPAAARQGCRQLASSMGRAPSAPLGQHHGTTQPPVADREHLWQWVLSGDLGGSCSHVPPLSYTGFSPMSSQHASSKLWVLSPGLPTLAPCHCPHASAALCGTAPVSCWLSVVLYQCLSVRQHPTPISIRVLCGEGWYSPCWRNVP